MRRAVAKRYSVRPKPRVFDPLHPRPADYLGWSFMLTGLRRCNLCQKTFKRGALAGWRFHIWTCGT